MGICSVILTAAMLVACGGGAATTNEAQVSNSAGGVSELFSEVGEATSISDPSTEPVSFVEAVAELADAQSASASAVAAASISEVNSDSMLSSAVQGASVVSTASVPDDEADESTNVSIMSAKSTINYVKVTDENQVFKVLGTATARFGDPATNRWVTKKVTELAECNNEFFGSDPALGTFKICQLPKASIVPAASGLSTPNGKMPVVDLAKVPAPLAGSLLLKVKATTEVPPASGGEFRTGCTFAHMSFDDPIVFPGQAGKSHLHTFFGNTLSNANSTPESLRTTGSSTCLGGIANRSAYWVSTMVDISTHKPLVPNGMEVYYKNGAIADASRVHAIPTGLRMVAGNPASTVPQSGGIARFKCIGGPNNENDKYGSTIPNCDVGAVVWQEIFFPQCWDGVNLDSPDHKSHMAYSIHGNGGSCPSTHPIPIPAITINVMYTVTVKDQPLHWRLSSDNYDSSIPGGLSAHGDWFNGWKSDISDAWAKNCIEGKKDCHAHLLGDGRMMY